MANTHTRNAAGRKIVDDAVAALAVWAAAVPPDDDALNHLTASPFQVAARAIDESLDSAKEVAGASDGLDFIYGQALVHTLDLALWNFMSDESPKMLSRAQLVKTANMAAAHLARASASLARGEREVTSHG